jgi:diguanylate cyclase (GGDEF)-like protein
MKAQNSTPRDWRRTLLGSGTLAAMALVLALAAVVELVSAAAATEGCLGLAAIGGACYGLLRSRYGARFSDASYVTAQLAAAFLILAWLTFRTDTAPALMPVLYVIAFLYGALLLDRVRLLIVGAVALVMHGVTLFLLIDHGHRIPLEAAWTQFGALVIAFAWLVYAGGVVLRLRTRLAQAHGRLHEMAEQSRARESRDSLTGAYNRAYLIDALEREIARAERIGKPLSIARVDLDHLGAVNETHGQAVGDIALKRFAQAAGSALRDVDHLGRYGGKGFLVLMPDTNLGGAVIAAERVRAAVSREPVPEVEGRRHLSCTVGVAEHRKGENTRLLLARAEAHLNLGKAGGHDRVVAEVR